ncbi:MAG: xylulokinase [Desulfofustis sp.]|jgi:D-xylulose kinase|nr:xylulokinase [Desulfofustis sp.]
MYDRLYIGLDSGTQGTKGVVISEHAKGIVAESYHGYGLIENDRGGREQHPDTWTTACARVLEDLLAAPAVSAAEVRAIGVSGQQHGMVALDSAGTVIRPAKLWCDTETADQCRRITERAGGEQAVVAHIGNQVAAGFTASKILWLKENEPDSYERLATVLLPHDYLNYWLTGNRVCEFGDASGTAYFDVVNRTWSMPLLDAIDASGTLKSCLPPFVAADEPAGRIRAAIGERFGLSPEVIVSSGGGDNMMAAIGTGNVSEGVVTASLGTSGTIYAFADRPVVDASGELAAFCSSTGGWLPLVCTMNVTVATELIRSLFDIGIDRLNELAGSVPAGAGGLLLLPYFNGERTPPLPSATAHLSGMTGRNLKPANICRAAMEGATFGLRYGLDVLKRNGIQPREIRLTGGGSKSALWRRLVADIFACPVVCLKEEEAGAVGAALQAMWCVATQEGGGVALPELTSSFVQLDETSRCFPEPSASAHYEELYRNYLTLNDALAPLNGAG